MSPPPAWLVVIDMQNVFADPASPWHVPRFAQTVAPILRLTRAYAPRVLFTRFVAPTVPAGAWRVFYEAWPFALTQPDHPMWEIVEPLRDAVPAARHAACAKGVFSKWGPELAGPAGGGAIVLAGVSTDGCVLATALAAADAGVRVMVVGEACAGIDDESHAAALEVLRPLDPLVRVISAAQALEEATV
ncbi:MAG: cysteine hydrolase [Bifidobacteriaceae bacterium]|nr:cysteine hydrolase [Bifidobacteriaceae bacterium]